MIFQKEDVRPCLIYDPDKGGDHTSLGDASPFS